jgi:Inhibitor of Apoptosis domain
MLLNGLTKPPHLIRSEIVVLYLFFIYANVPKLAEAGFYFSPSTGQPDNVTCFVCQGRFDGWEPEDDPISEHLKHMSSCGWALNASIKQRRDAGDKLPGQDPICAELIEARGATFMGQWPHEGKRGWQPKTEKVLSIAIW